MNVVDLFKNGGFEIINCTDSEELYRTVSNYLVSNDYVKKEFLSAILKREKEYPTGIEITPYNIALPHVDESYVLKDALFIYRLNNEIEYTKMDEHDKKINVKMVFLLLIHNLEYHVKAISELTRVWASNDIMKGLLLVNDSSQVSELIARELCL